MALPNLCTERRRQEPPHPSPKGKGGGKLLLTSPSDEDLSGRAAPGQGEAPGRTARRQRYVLSEAEEQVKVVICTNCFHQSFSGAILAELI